MCLFKHVLRSWKVLTFFIALLKDPRQKSLTSYNSTYLMLYLAQKLLIDTKPDTTIKDKVLISKSTINCGVCLHVCLCVCAPMCASAYVCLF